MSKIKITLVSVTVALTVIAVIALVFWDPANLFRLRTVENAQGTYRADTYPDGLNFTVESIIFSQDGNISLVIDGHEVTSEIGGVNDNVTQFLFSYGGEEYSVFCTRKSNAFKLVGTTSCDWLNCSLYERTQDAEKILGAFTAVRI